MTNERLLHEIVHDFPVLAPIGRVFEEISMPAGLDRWWTKSSVGLPIEGMLYDLGFGPEYQWTAIVTESRPPFGFELKIEDALPEWIGTKVRFELDEPTVRRTQVHFTHAGWAETTEHFRISSYCWAMYLRLMRRSVEHGELVPYETRLDA